MSSKTKLREAILFVILFFCPVVITWEAFLPNLRSYGNYGPLCWFRLELSDNYTSSSYNKLFLQTIPYALVYIVITVLILYCVAYIASYT